MAQVIVEIAGRNYPLTCREGDESRLMGLAAEIAGKADGLTKQLGPMAESRLLLMSALMIADELQDLRAGVAPPPAAVIDPALLARLAALTERAEKLGATLGAG